MAADAVWRTVVVAEQATALRSGASMIMWIHERPAHETAGVPLVARRLGTTQATSTVSLRRSRGQILALLRSGHARVAGHATVDGRKMMEIQPADGHTTYYLAPESSRPLS